MVDRCNLFVGGMPESATEESFKSMFEGYGDMVSCKYYTDRRQGYVRYATADEAEAVIGAVDGFIMEGSTLQVKVADPGQAKAVLQAPVLNGALLGLHTTENPPCENLYVQGLPPHMSDQTLTEIFGAYGTVSSVKILNPIGKGANGQQCTIATVKMGTVEQAQWMVTNVNHNIPQGLTDPVQIRFADPPSVLKVPTPGKGFGKAPGAMNGNRTGPYSSLANLIVLPGQMAQKGLSPGGAINLTGKGKGKNGKMTFADGAEGTNLYVRGLPADANDLWLYRTFGPFGGVESVRAIMQDDMCQGYGFVKFVQKDDAQAAMQSLAGYMLADGSMMQVSIKTEKKREAREILTPKVQLNLPAITNSATAPPPDPDEL